MKKSAFVLLTWLLANAHAYPAGTNVAGYAFNYQNVPSQMVLEQYQRLSGLELNFAPNLNRSASIDFAPPHPLTKAEAMTGLEQALKEQAGIVIKPLADNRAEVTFDASAMAPRIRPKLSAGRPEIVLTARDVVPKSVRLITSSNTPVQNVMFRYAAKTSAEIKAIVDAHPRAKIMRDGVVVAETAEGGCGGYTDQRTNYVGLVLIFAKYDEARAAEKALRGN